MSIIVFDNDECTGQYGTFSIFYNMYITKGWNRDLSEEKFVKIMQPYFKDFGGRPWSKKITWFS